MRAHPFVAAAIAGTSFLVPQVSSAVVVPFSENYDSFPIGTATPTNFTQTSNHYSIVAGSGAGDNDYRAILSIGNGGLSSSAAVTAAELAGNSFTVSTEFSIASFTAEASSTVNSGLGLLGSSGNFSGGSEYRVLFTLAAPTAAGQAGSTGTINIQEGTTILAGISVGSAIPIVKDVIYSLSVSGTYSPTGALTLAATVTNLTSGATTTSSATDTTPLTGQYFGYRTAINASGGPAAETINYDNFSVIPEPSTALALLSGIGILGFRRRRS